jgi:hypothetical protein
MKIIVIFIVLFGGLAISRSIGMSESAQIVGALIGIGAYALIIMRGTKK